MNNVFVALWSSQMDADFVGVFSTRELAQKAAEKFQEECRYGDGYVEEWEIDGEMIPETMKLFKGGKWI
jgi:hypothetical protein